MGRYELKYYISKSTAESLKSVFGALFETDSHSGADGSYMISSTYFDDRNFTSYNEKNAGNDFRDRWRIRSYNGADDFINLERKSKRGDTSVKSGKRISAETAISLMTNGVKELPLPQGKSLLVDFFADISQKSLIPVVTVDYKRTAFMPHLSDVRITIDENIRACRYRTPFDRDTAKLLLPDEGLTILEVKYTAAMPEMVKSILNRYPMDRCSISKYVMSLEPFIE
ncbi:MAG: polyphosphate polymerase domain-containing protein [Clostridia bacterium]|nr:polyphosphate polymerase domain-containing protein [Clostridia bacterium]